MRQGTNLEVEPTEYGRVIEIIRPSHLSTYNQGSARDHLTNILLTVEKFDLQATPHRDLEMPVLQPSGIVKVIKSVVRFALSPDASSSNQSSDQEVQCNVNVQHDCITEGCQPVHVTAQTQERTQTDIPKINIEHHGRRLYIINLLSIHNANLIRSSLPKHLYNMPQTVTDRMEHRARCAKALTDSKLRKKADQQEKVRKILKKVGQPTVTMHGAAAELAGDKPGELEGRQATGLHEPDTGVNGGQQEDSMGMVTERNELMNLLANANPRQLRGPRQKKSRAVTHKTSSSNV